MTSRLHLVVTEDVVTPEQWCPYNESSGFTLPESSTRVTWIFSDFHEVAEAIRRHPSNSSAVACPPVDTGPPSVVAGGQGATGLPVPSGEVTSLPVAPPAESTKADAPTADTAEAS